MRCKRPVGLTTNEDGESYLTPCKTWACPDCGVIKRARLRDDIEFGMYSMMQDGIKIRYFVITTRLGTDYEKLMQAWNRLMTALRKHFRHLNKRIDYVWVTELGEKNGMLHRHGFFTQYIDNIYLSRLWNLASIWLKS
jgi:hypothetical protein